ncbi:hypothetical protein [Clostridium butyricum]
MERYLIESINKYIDILKDINASLDLSKYYKEEYILSNKGNKDLKKRYKQIKEDILLEVQSIVDLIDDKKSLLVATFVNRCNFRAAFYNRDNKEVDTLWFKIYNMIFFEIYHNQKKEKKICVLNNYEIKNMLERMIKLIYHYWDNIEYYNTHIIASDNECEEPYKEYMDKIKEITAKQDMHVRIIHDPNILKNIYSKNIDAISLKKNFLNIIKDCYYSKEEYMNNISLESEIIKLNISNPRDDLIIIRRDGLNDSTSIEKRFVEFILLFSAKTSKQAVDVENELIFSYISENYVYLSKSCMKFTQDIIETFGTWGQYNDKLLKYYFNINIPSKLQSDYTKLMTYKIADLLYTNGYRLPRDSRDNLLPLIEIQKYYPNYSKDDGDIDVLFMSEKRKIIYNLEYKNFQMLITKENDLSSEINKVEKTKVFQHVRHREKLIKNNMKYILNNFFNIDDGDFKVKSIILTTKPNFYFYKNKQTDIEYLEWTEFLRKVYKTEY